MVGFVELVNGEECGATDELEAESEGRFAQGTMEKLPAMPALSWSLAGVSWEGDSDIEASSDPVLVVDGEGHIITANKNVEARLGYAIDELRGRSVDTLLISSRHPGAASVFPASGIHFVSADRGVRVVHRNGQQLAAELVISVDSHGITIIVRALETERISLREEDMAEIVHDLKSPLSTIALEAHLLGDRLAASHQVGRIERNVAYMDRLVHELLDLCSIDAGRFSIQRRPTELRGLLDRVLDRILSTADRDRVYLDASSSVVVACDDGRVERVLANFLENALKYAPARSAIVVRLSVSASHASVSVIDSGPGIPEHEKATLFDKYRRASTARGHTGSGLGLYVSRKIIEAHGGRVGVENMRKGGSRFFFELPVTGRVGMAVGTAQHVIERPYVLVVDDEIDQAAGLSEILRDEGYETALATSAHEALMSVRSRRPHTLIVDARLRGSDGIELLFRVHEEQPEIPTLILTGLPREEPRIAAAIHALGCEYLEKPVDVYRLLSVVEQLRPR